MKNFFMIVDFFWLWCYSPCRALASSFSNLLDHTQAHEHPAGLIWTDCQPSAEATTYIIHNNHSRRHIHTFSGIRTRNPSNRTVADLRLRPHAHWDRRISRTRTSYYILRLLSPVFDLVLHHRHTSYCEVASKPPWAGEITVLGK
jgi:hypothetical protein